MGATTITTLNDVLEAAMKLSEAERRELADRLFLTLSPERQAEIDRAWGGEAERRYAAYKAGKVGTVDYHEAMRSIRERLK
jgi:putative addiction module component (TIGR02574 family)